MTDDDVVLVKGVNDRKSQTNKLH